MIMITNTFQDLTLSRLGFGAMRLPMMETDPSKIDEEQVFRMVDYALENGINYFDTAFPYHAGYSEIVLGKLRRGYTVVLCSAGSSRVSPSL